MTVICFDNNKGGVGKTTTAANVAAGLGELGHKVLAIDFDGQCNLNLYLTGEKHHDNNIFDLMLDSDGNIDVVKCIIKAKSEFKNVYLLPAGERLARLDKYLEDEIEKELILKEIVDLVKKKFDYVLIDCPPSLDISVVNALCASDYYVIMRDMNYFSRLGEEKIKHAAKKIQKRLNPNLKFAGCILSKTQKENATNVKVLINSFKEDNRGNLVNAQIPHSAHFTKDDSNFLPIFNIAPKSSKVYKRYKELTNQISSLR